MWLEFRIQGGWSLGLRIQDLGLGVKSLCFRIQGLGFRIESMRCLHRSFQIPQGKSRNAVGGEWRGVRTSVVHTSSITPNIVSKVPIQPSDVAHMGTLLIRVALSLPQRVRLLGLVSS